MVVPLASASFDASPALIFAALLATGDASTKSILGMAALRSPHLHFSCLDGPASPRRALPPSIR